MKQLHFIAFCLENLLNEGEVYRQHIRDEDSMGFLHFLGEFGVVIIHVLFFKIIKFLLDLGYCLIYQNLVFSSLGVRERKKGLRPFDFIISHCGEGLLLRGGRTRSFKRQLLVNLRSR